MLTKLDELSIDSQTEEFINIMYHTLLDPLCYQHGNFLQIVKTDPSTTNPPGCIIKSFTFFEGEICQVEIRFSKEDNAYCIWVGSNRRGNLTFHSSKFEILQLIFIYLSILVKSSFASSEILEDFKGRTGICEFQPKKWTVFDALLHHCVLTSRWNFKLNKKKQLSFTSLGWCVKYEENLLLVKGFEKNIEYDFSVRWPIGRCLRGDENVLLKH